MKLVIALIRCGATKGEKQGRYVAQLDEELDDAQRAAITERAAQGIYPPVELIFCGHLSRCVHTAQLAYYNIPILMEKSLAPLDIGKYAGLKYHEITEDKQFRDWASETEPMPLGGGEKPYAFQARCLHAFKKITGEMANKGIGAAAIVSHRQVLEKLLQRYALPRNYYKHWEVPYAGGYLLEFDTRDQMAKIIRKI